ncbi:hypothetical protein SRABI128_04520 [Microbacterium sp. Bi128]|nr:hypothetical protein SRABI128_04520 [Microbacterium sp. Bi128]
MPAVEGHGAAGGRVDRRAALGGEILAAVELPRAPGNGADTVAEGRGRDQLVERRTQGAGRCRAGDGAHRLGAQQLLEFPVRIALRGDGRAVEVDFGGGGSGDIRLHGSGERAGPARIRSHHRARDGDRHGQNQTSCGQGDPGLLPDPAGRGKVRDLAERTATATAFIPVHVPRAFGRVCDDGTRLRCGTGRAATAPGGLGGQERFLSGWPAKLAVGFGSERSKTRSAVASSHAQMHPQGILRWKLLAADGLHPKAAEVAAESGSPAPARR